MSAAIKRWILEKGEVLGPEFLKVDSFLNHRIDPRFVSLAGEELVSHFADVKVNIVLTAEAAGNVIAYEVARRLDAMAIYAKKGVASTMGAPLTRRISSPTKGGAVELSVSREYLGPGERVLVVDDFLYRGTTSRALAEMVLEARATLVGFGFVIEKGFSGGRKVLDPFGVPVVSLAIIEHMDPKTGKIIFRE